MPFTLGLAVHAKSGRGCVVYVREQLDRMR
jgi:hypothetical protein